MRTGLLNLASIAAMTAAITSCTTASDDAAPDYAIAHPIVVITDMEPDDRIALHVVAALYPDRLALIGTTVMHAYRKKLLAERLMRQLGLGRVPVLQGSGGDAKSYPDIASSRAARAYDHEGAGILDDQSLLEANEHPRSSKDFQNALQKLLGEYSQIEIFVLAPPTDLVNVLNRDPDLAGRISRIHLMGGWAEVDTTAGVELRSTYNWNMDPAAARQLLAFRSIPVTLYSSHTIKQQFSGGSIQASNFPGVIDALESHADSSPGIAETLIAARSWDNHVMDQIPALEQVIGRENAGRQFSPADSLVVIGSYNEKLAVKTTSVSAALIEQDLNPDRGYRIDLPSAQDANIELIEQFDLVVFEQVLRSALTGLQ